MILARRWLAGLSAAALLLSLPPARADYSMESLAHDAFGSVRAYRAATPPKGLVLLLSDADGWTRSMDALAWNMVEKNYVVAGIDTAAYRQPGARMLTLLQWLDLHFNHDYEGIVSRLLSAWPMD